MIPRKIEINQSAPIRPGEISKQLLKTIRGLSLKKANKKNNEKEKISGREWRYTNLCENYYQDVVGECSDITKF